MKKFEYRVQEMQKGGRHLYEVQEELDNYGREGWELCTVEYGCWIFKRELRE